MVLGNKFIVKQEIEALEIFTGFETGNRYSILDERGNKFLYAYEDESNFISKQFLGQHRGLKLHILDNNKNEIFTIERPFYFLNSKAKIKLSDGNLFGSIIQRKWLATKQFDFILPDGRILFSCISKVPHIWTFKVFMNNQEIAQILKKWSGSGKEFFTDTDNFMIDVSNIQDDSTKYAVLITAFIIDLRVFERRS
ncbi:MAG: phospholipid scramblase-related protein [Promethearchaeota archaeon]